MLTLFRTGVVTCKNILDLKSEDIKRTFDVNVISHYHVRISFKYSNIIYFV